MKAKIIDKYKELKDEIERLSKIDARGNPIVNWEDKNDKYIFEILDEACSSLQQIDEYRISQEKDWNTCWGDICTGCYRCSDDSA